MDSYRLEKGFAHQYLTRWIEYYSLEFKYKNEHDANFLLSSKVRNSKLGNDLIPTALERAAADVLALVCAIEHSISTDEAMILFNGVPTIKVLSKSLEDSVNVLEKMTGNDCITKSNIAITESLNQILSSLQPNLNIQETKTGSENPWNIIEPNDPTPKQKWYTPARYFARQLVKDDSTLLTKRKLLAFKVAQSLTNSGFYKRGGVRSLDPATVEKAFNRVSLG